MYQEPTVFEDLTRRRERLRRASHPHAASAPSTGGRCAPRRPASSASSAVDIDPDTPVRGLGVADRQLLEIAKALSSSARLLIMDEPTAALSPHEVDNLFGIVRQLRERGVAVLYISHRLEEVGELADIVTVLRDGRHIETRPATELSQARSSGSWSGARSTRSSRRRRSRSATSSSAPRDLPAAASSPTSRSSSAAARSSASPASSARAGRRSRGPSSASTRSTAAALDRRPRRSRRGRRGRRCAAGSPTCPRTACTRA